MTTVKRMKQLAGKVAIVTGGRGIGAGIASVFAHAGAKVVLATRTLEYGQHTVDAIRGAGGEATAVECDISDRDQVFRMVAGAVKHYGGADLLVNNAAVFPRAYIEDMTPQDVAFAIDVNLKGPIWLVQACLPYLKRARHGGRIVLISSLGGTRLGTPMYSAYNATKAAVNGLSMTLANELARFQITSNVVEPGATESSAFLRNYSSEAVRKAVAAAIPLGRIVQPADIGHACLFFCSPENAMVTGQALAVDGGTSTGGALAPPENADYAGRPPDGK
jgi:3-oxoacyl-[acyl-carrier protein] reductase